MVQDLYNIIPACRDTAHQLELNKHTLNIKLIKSGGFIGKKMTASAEWTLSAKDWDELVETIRRQEGTTRMRDAFHYSLQKNDDEQSRVPVSIQNIPPKFSAVFKELFDNMKAGE